MTDSFNKHEERYLYDIKPLGVVSNVSDTGEAGRASVGWDKLSGTSASPLRSMQNKKDGERRRTVKAFGRRAGGRGQTWLSNKSLKK